MPENEADKETELRAVLADRIAVTERLLEAIGDAPYKSLNGITRFRARLNSELSFLRKIAVDKRKIEPKYVETSNVIHLQNVFDAITVFPNVTAVSQTFSIYERELDCVLKHVVDLVAENGRRWIKLISRNARGVTLDWVTGKERNIFEQAEVYSDMASRFPLRGSTPRITFYFVRGCSEEMAQRLERRRIEVLGNRFPLSSLVAVPADFIEMLEEEDERLAAEQASSSKNLNDPGLVNLDVSAVFALISNVTHEGGTDHVFASSLLTQQAEMEKLEPARPFLVKAIEDRQLIMCKTAFDSVQEIVRTVGGETEKQRLAELLTKIEVREDAVSERCQTLEASDRITERSKIIFGSGDSYGAVTASANKHFVASALQQGVHFDAILHPSRALSEQKERP